VNDLYEKAVEYVLTMPKTERQVRLWLSRKTQDAGVIDSTVERLKEYNFIDDAEYARMYVESKRNKLGVGMIRNKLQINGVDRGIIDTCIGTVEPQYELAASVTHKYMRSKEKTPEAKSKLFQYLLSKGFNYELSGEVINEYWD
jgi:regulatory protein